MEDEGFVVIQRMILKLFCQLHGRRILFYKIRCLSLVEWRGKDEDEWPLLTKLPSSVDDELMFHKLMGVFENWSAISVCADVLVLLIFLIPSMGLCTDTQVT